MKLNEPTAIVEYVKGDIGVSQRADYAHKLFEALGGLTGDQTGLFLDLGKILKEINDRGLYKELGADSFREFVGFPEIGVAQATAYAYAQLYETFVEQYGFSRARLTQISWTKLRDILPVIRKNKLEINEVEKWMEMAEVLSRSDLKDEVGDAIEREVDPNAIPRPKLFRHAKCNRWIIDADPDQLCTCNVENKEDELAIKMSGYRQWLIEHNQREALEQYDLIMGFTS